MIEHASKVLLKIIKGRIKLQYDREMAEEQAGVVEGKGTREHGVNIRIIIEKCRDQNIPLYYTGMDNLFEQPASSRLFRRISVQGVIRTIVVLRYYVIRTIVVLTQYNGVFGTTGQVVPTSGQVVETTCECSVVSTTDFYQLSGSVQLQI